MRSSTAETLQNRTKYRSNLKTEGHSVRMAQDDPKVGDIGPTFRHSGVQKSTKPKVKLRKKCSP
jgi:hypothetical protein